MSGEAEAAFGHRARRGPSGEAESSLRRSGGAEPSPQGSGEVESSPQPSGEAEPSPRCRGRMGRDHSLKQSQSPVLSGSAKHAIPGMVCHVSRAGSREKEDPAPSKDLLYLCFFPLSPICNPCSPWSIKGRAGHPTRGRIDSTHNTQPSSNRALGILSTFPLETWDLSLS